METRVTWRRRIKRGQFKKNPLRLKRRRSSRHVEERFTLKATPMISFKTLSLSIDTLCCCHKFRNENVFIYAKTLVVCLVQPQIIYTEFKRVRRKKEKERDNYVHFFFKRLSVTHDFTSCGASSTMWFRLARPEEGQHETKQQKKKGNSCVKWPN